MQTAAKRWVSSTPPPDTNLMTSRAYPVLWNGFFGIAGQCGWRHQCFFRAPRCHGNPRNACPLEHPYLLATPVKDCAPSANLDALDRV